MTDYNFDTLNDEDFEELVNDILQEELGCRLERFKKGPDEGMDGRISFSKEKSIIVQSKHYVGSTFSQLKSSLKNSEVAKVFNLNPYQYILATSQDLNPKMKRELVAVFKPYLKARDIYTKKDINAFLRKYKEIERSHYKLWLSSSNILSHLLDAGIYRRSSYKLKEIRDSVNLYVKTNFHYEAMNMLKTKHCLLISGNPGVGKTTLAGQLCNEFVTSGYQFIEVKKDIEKAWEVLKEDVAQVFYFDDFLGANYLRKFEKHEDSEIIDFVKAVNRNSSGKKKIIITSRASILNQGFKKSSAFKYSALKTFYFHLNIENLLDEDKARILRNHLFFELPRPFLDSVIKDEFYLSIINHENYNPRVIEAITDKEIIGKVTPDEYQDFILKGLDDLEFLWQEPFEENLREAERTLLYLLTINIDPVTRLTLETQYITYHRLNESVCGDIEFNNCLTTVIGAFVAKTITNEAEFLRSANPSISDFIIDRLRHLNSDVLIRLILSVNSPEVIADLRDMGLSENKLDRVAGEVLQFCINDYSQYSSMLISCLEHLDFSSESLSYLNLDEFLYAIFLAYINGSGHLDTDTLLTLCIASIKTRTLTDNNNIVSIFTCLDHVSPDDVDDIVKASTLISALEDNQAPIKKVKRDWENNTLKYWLDPNNIIANALIFFEIDELCDAEMFESCIKGSLTSRLDQFSCEIHFSAQTILDKTDWTKLKEALKKFINEHDELEKDTYEYDESIINITPERSNFFNKNYLSVEDIFKG